MEIIIKSLHDLQKLEKLEQQGIKINISELARKLQVDRRTVKKYMDGYRKPTTKNRPSQFDRYYAIIDELLNDKTKKFHYKRDLYQYLVNTHGMVGAESGFRRYIGLKEEFHKYFSKSK